MQTATEDVVQQRLTSRWATGVCAIVLLCLIFWLGRRSVHPVTQTSYVGVPLGAAAAVPEGDVTQLWAHNVVLRKGPHFRLYLHWIRGRMLPTDKNRIPSLDAPDSFVLNIEKGVADARLGDFSDYLNSIPQKSSLKDMQVENHDGELQIKAMAHKGLWLPVRLDGELSPAPGGRVRFHLKKLNVLKMPMKGLFGLFHIELSDLLPKEPIAGMQLSGNDIFFDSLRLLPPPHAHGDITAVQLSGDHVRVIYGNARADDSRMAQWHNFLQLTGGVVSFGKLTMNHADLTLIDTTEDPWFDLDLVNYQTQLVYGTTKITRRAGVEMYMPDLDHLPPDAGKAAQGVSVDWLRNRNTTPPPLDVTDAPKK